MKKKMEKEKESFWTEEDTEVLVREADELGTEIPLVKQNRKRKKNGPTKR